MHSTIKTFSDFTRFYSSILTFIENDIGTPQYSLQEIRVLCALYETGETSTANILRMVRTHKRNLNRTLGRLRFLGIIWMERNRKDRRFLIVGLTAKGVAETKGWLDFYELRHKEILSGITPARHARLTKAMKTIKDILGKTPISPA